MTSDRPMPQSAAAEPTPPDATPHDDDAAATAQALATLSTSQRQVLWLSYFQHLTQQQIAARLGLPLAVVQASAATGLQKLGEALSVRGHGGRRSRDVSHA